MTGCHHDHDSVQFTCDHCGRDVPFGQFEGECKPRNHCPYCLWSKHVSIGEEFGYPPCGGMMRGVDTGADVVTRCLGCGFTYRAPTDDYMFRALSSAGLVKHLPAAILTHRSAVAARLAAGPDEAA